MTIIRIRGDIGIKVLLEAKACTLLEAKACTLVEAMGTGIEEAMGTGIEEAMGSVRWYTIAERVATL